MKPFSNKKVLFGAASAILVDVEESCLRNEFEIIAIVHNCQCQPQAIHSDKIRKISELTKDLLEHSWMFTLFVPEHRKNAVEEARNSGVKNFDPIIDPTAILPKNIEINDGVYINAGAVIGSKTSLGAFSFINRGVTLGHHVSIGEFVSFGPRVVTGGNVSIGQETLIGVGAIILPNIKIGTNVVVGGGAVVTRDVPNNTMVMGNPAKIIKTDIRGYTGACA